MNKNLTKLLLYLNDGYLGTGGITGAPSFHGNAFGFGGTKQLAAQRLNPATARMRDEEQEEYNRNELDQQKYNMGYPIPQVNAGGDGSGAIRSGRPVPEYPDVDLDLYDEDEAEELEEAQMGSAGIGRSGPGDGNYRHLMGFPRMNTIQNPKRFVPPVEDDVDGDGEADEYMDIETYMQLLKPDLKEDWYDLPAKGTEPYKQGKLTLDSDPDSGKKLIFRRDFSKGADAFPPGPISNTSYGAIVAPRNFIPQDWGQRKTDDMDIEESRLHNLIKRLVKEIVDEAYTGIDDETGDGDSKGGSARFEKNREEVIELDKKERKSSIPNKTPGKD